MNIKLERKEKEETPSMDPCCGPSKYPSVWISESYGLSEGNFEIGQEVILKGKIASISERETTESSTCEISVDVMELSTSGNIKRKSEDSKNSDEIDKGLDEVISKKSKKEDDDESDDSSDEE